MNGILDQRRRKLELERFFVDHHLSADNPVLFVPTSSPLSEDEIIRRCRLKSDSDGQTENSFEIVGDAVKCCNNCIASILIKAGYVPKLLQ